MAVPLAARLLAAAEWFNSALRQRLADRGWPAISRNQSQVFTLLGVEGASQSDIARGLDITRQSAHTLLRQLSDLGLVAERTDPRDRRKVRVHLTEEGERFAADAREVLADLEGTLTRRIGDEAVVALRAALATDWGGPPHAETPAPSDAGADVG